MRALDPIAENSGFVFIMSEVEIWKGVKGLEGIYEVSNKGRIRSLDRIEVMKNGVARPRAGRIIKPSIKANGYYCFHFSIKGKTKEASVHRMVADAFIPNPLKLPCVNHKDRNKLNNNVENLEWCTYRYNSMYQGARERAVETRNCRKVKQFSKEGEFIMEHKSEAAAAKAMGLSVGNLSSTLHGLQKTFGGYIWRYSDET